MNDRDILIEILAIQLYEHDNSDGLWPSRGAFTSWRAQSEEDRQLYRDIVINATGPDGMYEPPEGKR